MDWGCAFPRRVSRVSVKPPGFAENDATGCKVASWAPRCPRKPSANFCVNRHSRCFSSTKLARRHNRGPVSSSVRWHCEISVAIERRQQVLRADALEPTSGRPCCRHSYGRRGCRPHFRRPRPSVGPPPRRMTVILSAVDWPRSLLGTFHLISRLHEPTSITPSVSFCCPRFIKIGGSSASWTVARRFASSYVP